VCSFVVRLQPGEFASGEKFETRRRSDVRNSVCQRCLMNRGDGITATTIEVVPLLVARRRSGHSRVPLAKAAFQIPHGPFQTMVLAEQFSGDRCPQPRVWRARYRSQDHRHLSPENCLCQNHRLNGPWGYLKCPLSPRALSKWPEPSPRPPAAHHFVVGGVIPSRFIKRRDRQNFRTSRPRRRVPRISRRTQTPRREALTDK